MKKLLKKSVAVGIGCYLSGFSFTAVAAGDTQAGMEKSATCVACHQTDGNSTDPTMPKIAGQHASYLAKQLYDFKSGEEGGRNNAIMSPMVAALSDQDIADLAAYYSEQTISLQGADPELVEQGQNLYLGGDLERAIPACTGCHGPAGRGNPAAKFPLLAGQHAEYTAQQLKAFRAMTRSNDPNQMMRDIAIKLTDPEIAALAAYIQGLRENN